MTRFKDGPAKGKTLMLRRAARFLRVTFKDGKFDALDQPEDKPLPGEMLYVYEIVCLPGFAFLDGPKVRGRYAIAEYSFVEPQPKLDILRHTALWDLWVREESARRPRPDLKTPQNES